MNQTLLERVRCILSSAGFSKNFWGEIVTAVAYLINISPTSALKFKTPEELWRVRPANYGKLIVVGCLAYVHTKQDKLEARAVKCVLVGYPTCVKGYSLWNLDEHKFVTSRYVTFDESKMTSKAEQENSNQKGQTHVILESNMVKNYFVTVTSDEESDNDDTSQTDIHGSYGLARDRERRTPSSIC